MSGVKGLTPEAQYTFLDDLRGVADASANLLSQPSSSTSRMIRKGLVVASFNSFEGFVKSRFKELSNSVEDYKQGRLLFGSMPEDVQKPILKHVANVTSSYLGRVNKDTDLNLILPQLNDLGDFLSHASSKRMFSESIGWWAGSNISKEGIRDLLRMLRVKTPWDVMSSIEFHFGKVNPDMCKLAESRISLRHNAAHDPKFDCGNLELEEHVRELRSLAFGIDVLSSTAASLLACGDEVFFKKDTHITGDHFNSFWEVVPRAKDYAAYRKSGVNRSVGGNRAFRKHSDLFALISIVKQYWNKGEYIVVKDEYGQVDWWLPWSYWP